MQRHTIILVVFFITGLIFLGVYGTLFGKHAPNTLSDTLTIDFNDITNRVEGSG